MDYPEGFLWSFILHFLIYEETDRIYIYIYLEESLICAAMLNQELLIVPPLPISMKHILR